MADDDSPQTHEDKSRRTWLDRITAALSGEPTTREDLVELLRDVQADGLIAADTLRMMEGAIAVSDLTVGDVMIPSAQMPMTFRARTSSGARLIAARTMAPRGAEV